MPAGRSRSRRDTSTRPNINASCRSASRERSDGQASWGGPLVTQPDPYVLGYRQAEQVRLQQQAEQLAHESSWLFDQVGIPAGARVVEIGCGPIGCLALLSER